MDGTIVNEDALKSEIRQALINQKVNACPIAMRIAWHAGGTYDKKDGSGGSDGATMRFEPQVYDEANKGLSIIRDLLLPIKENHPEISQADLWAFAGCAAIEFLGGPKIPFKFGRKDDEKPVRVPPNGRLPDASQGAGHIRQVFYRMGFDDKEIVALSGGHTLGRMHEIRSGYDGPWTHTPLKFNNDYYKHLVEKKWKLKDWSGKKMYTDVETGTLGMLPTDIALIEDPSLKKFTVQFAKDEKLFFEEFAKAYAKLMCLGCPPRCNPFLRDEKVSERDKASMEFREYAMHGAILPCKELAKGGLADVKAVEPTSGRTALHKAAFWGHPKPFISFLVNDCKIDPNVQDIFGDTALHDAAKFGHADVCQVLVDAGTDLTLRNKNGRTALEVAQVHSPKFALKAPPEAGGYPNHPACISIISAGKRSKL
mmetsp:Transcript_10316/g.23581  ORF Transcript_10316/g.23581 Transcript_10316/m.23581 type:complete len:426 (-) Transcript_10316:1483-2760(-)|eukprot:759492-Hanusia_phi.AAC.1